MRTYPYLLYALYEVQGSAHSAPGGLGGDKQLRFGGMKASALRQQHTVAQDPPRG